MRVWLARSSSTSRIFKIMHQKRVHRGLEIFQRSILCKIYQAVDKCQRLFPIVVCSKLLAQLLMPHCLQTWTQQRFQIRGRPKMRLRETDTYLNWQTKMWRNQRIRSAQTNLYKIGIDISKQRNMALNLLILSERLNSLLRKRIR